MGPVGMDGANGVRAARCGGLAREGDGGRTPWAGGGGLRAERALRGGEWWVGWRLNEEQILATHRSGLTIQWQHRTDTPTGPPPKDIANTSHGPLHHCGGTGRHALASPLRWQARRTLRSQDSKTPNSYVKGPAFPGARPCLRGTRGVITQPRPTSGRYTFCVLDRPRALPQRWHARVQAVGGSTAVGHATQRRSA